VAPLAFLLAAAMGGGWVAAAGDGVLRAVRAASYQPPGWYWPLLVGGIGMAAAALVGLGLGRLMPSRLAAPLLGIAALALLIVPVSVWHDSPSPVLLLVPGHLGPAADEWSVVAGRTHAGQALWFVGLAAAGWALCAGTRRWLAAVAVLAGLAAATAVLPTAGRATSRDVHAAELVCADGTPRVCVTRLYAPILPTLVGPAREALDLLRKLPDPPNAVEQGTEPYATDVAQRRDTVHLLLTIYADGTAWNLKDSVLEGAGTWACAGPDPDLDTWNRTLAAREVARLWLSDATPRDGEDALVTDALTALRGLPVAGQAARVGAMREAALACRPDQYEILIGRT
jgi:hypothetical protein